MRFLSNYAFNSRDATARTYVCTFAQHFKKVSQLVISVIGGEQ